jgi:hypothetical protein
MSTEAAAVVDVEWIGARLDDPDLRLAGVTEEKRVIALTPLLGYADVPVYYGSWCVWGNAPDAPIEP